MNALKMNALKLFSPAKINLFLHILERRTDGYHNLFMLMEKIALFDEILLEKIDDGIEVVGAPSEIPLEKNLVFRAAEILQQTAKITQGVRIHLKKNIPLGGGLGGGSSNAATVLKGLNQLWELNWSIPKLADLSIQLGADVPFFLYDGAALVTGIGDRVKTLGNLPHLSMILIHPGIPVATPSAYAAWDEERKNPLTRKNQSVSVPRDLGFKAIISLLHNDFETVIFPRYPLIQKAKEALLTQGAKGALMSGSGSSVFGIFESNAQRDKVLEKIELKPGWQIFAVGNVGAGGFEPPNAGIKIL